MVFIQGISGLVIDVTVCEIGRLWESEKGICPKSTQKLLKKERDVAAGGKKPVKEDQVV